MQKIGKSNQSPYVAVLLALQLALGWSPLAAQEAVAPKEPQEPKEAAEDAGKEEDSKEEEKKTLPEDVETVIEGPTLITQEQAEKLADAKVSDGGETIRWAGIDIPESDATTHFAIVGGPGTGKTLR